MNVDQRVDAELDAAGIDDAALRDDYRHCRQLAAEHGRTYFLATRFLPPARRPAIHALYGFARTADDIVDDPSPTVTVEAKTAALEEFSASVSQQRPADPSVRAALDTAARYDLDPELFRAFLHSMHMDLTVTEYATFEALQEYVYGSAAVIGLMTTPILGTVGPVDDALPYAGDLGIAFQLTNFIRDVGEDVQLGRIYLPMDSLTEHGVDRERLQHCRTSGVADGAVKQLLAAEIERTREIYRRARPGIDRLEPRARRCVAVAYRLYSEILAEIERADYQIFEQRVTVPRRRRLGWALRAFTGPAATCSRIAVVPPPADRARSSTTA